MSTIVAVKENGRVVIAGDTLVRQGEVKLSSKHRVGTDKIIKCGESYVGLVVSGAVTRVFFSSR